MFSKRKRRSARAGADQKEETTMTSKPREAPRSSGGTAMIGPSIHVDGKLNGDEDLVIEGRVKGTVELKNNSVTIGSQGEVQADVYAHTIYVDGSMDGNLVATEQVVVRNSSPVIGAVTPLRVSSEDGARYNDSIHRDSKRDTQLKAAPNKVKPAAQPSKSGKELSHRFLRPRGKNASEHQRSHGAAGAGKRG